MATQACTAAWLWRTFTIFSTGQTVRPTLLLYVSISDSHPAVAYRLNATVDNAYAKSLKTAIVPSSQKSLFSSLRSVLPYSQTNPNLPPPVARLPSNIELETHNFSREEIAEKRMYLLNDNGQIDYFLSAGGGALENQYLQMLGSHSSYWYSRDYARMVVCEVGRRAGKQNTLTAMRVQKNRK